MDKKRPAWVWVISIFFFFSAAYTLLSFYLVYSGSIPLRPEQKAYFASLTFIDLGLTVFIGSTNLIGAVLFFLLRKQAFYFFVSSLAVNISMTVWHIFTRGLLTSAFQPELVGILIGWAMLAAVCIYTRRLQKTGVLV